MENNKRMTDIKQPMKASDKLEECEVIVTFTSNKRKHFKRMNLLLRNREISFYEKRKIERGLTATQLKNGYKIESITPKGYIHKIHE